MRETTGKKLKTREFLIPIENPAKQEKGLR
jgi:hypothetical protein